MRLQTLDLIRYGKFNGQTLEFPQADCDFHLIVGANEAGKSTLRRAVSDLLFGMPLRSCQAGTHMQMPGILSNIVQPHIGLLRQLICECTACDFNQWLPGRLRCQYKGRDANLWASCQQALCRRVGRAHDAVGINYQHAIGQGFNHQFIDLGLHACHLLAGFGQLLFTRKAQGQLVRQQCHCKKA